MIKEKDSDTGKVSYKQVFPRYHQLVGLEVDGVNVVDSVVVTDRVNLDRQIKNTIKQFMGQDYV